MNIDYIMIWIYISDPHEISTYPYNLTVNMINPFIPEMTGLICCL